MMDMFLPAMGTCAPSSGGTTAASTTPSTAKGFGDTAEGDDFLTLLTALLPDEPLAVDVSDVQVAAALQELATLGHRPGDDLDPGDWPIPAQLARFIAPPLAAIDAEVEGLPAAGIAAPEPGQPSPPGPAAQTTEVTTPVTGPGAEAPHAVPTVASRPDDPEGGQPAEGMPTSGSRVVGHGTEGRDRVDASPGEAVSTAARGAAVERTDAMGTVAGSLLRESTARNLDVDASRPSVEAVRPPVEGPQAMHSGALLESDVAIRETSGPQGASIRSHAASAASVQRVLDAVELLENAPPPRHLTLELADGRLRVAIEEGQVRLSLLGERGEDASRLLDDARAALEERGFDLGRDPDADDGERPGQDTDRPSRPLRPRSAPRAVAGLRL